MENVVYILGAGFSAPLGLPVMANFIDMAHEIYETHKNEYPHFGKVFQSIKQRLAYITLFYNSNLDNIEEVLSILEMERLVGGISSKEVEEFESFIIDVVDYYTPVLVNNHGFGILSNGVYSSSNIKLEEWKYRDELNLSGVHKLYGAFVLNLFNKDFNVNILNPDEKRKYKEEEGINVFEAKCVESSPTNTEYSIVSLNYDLVLENAAKYYSSITSSEELLFSRPQKKSHYGPKLVKLHGSIDDKTIIAPTWNKSIHNKIEAEWRNAFNLLSSANQIRIIGYSLPESDAYIKYLFKSSMIDSENLKRIDVICKDGFGTVSSKYSAFIANQFGPKFQFKNGDTESYLEQIRNDIESGHKNYFSR